MFLLIIFFASMFVASDIVVSDSWIRPGAKGMNTAIYFTVTNNSDAADTLYDAKCEVSNVVEVHETYKSGDMMGMRKANFVVIKKKSTFSFKPGGHHVMLIDLKKKLKVGEKYSCTLIFKKAGEVKVESVVKK